MLEQKKALANAGAFSVWRQPICDYAIYIPNWDIFIIPSWYNVVKVIFMRLKELRTKAKISQLKLALDLGLNQNSISRYESGERQPDNKTLIAFADYFGVSVDYLLERTDNPKMNV